MHGQLDEDFDHHAGCWIAIGDCALFKVGNAPPFIGIIRKLSAEEGGNLKLGVNWLYRVGDIKLSTGACCEAAPNEIFYFFHKDGISAALVLHPCKVAFHGRGAKLPFGVSCFVCRRVYDAANKCLYWLTDQEYVDEHQAEVGQLLKRTELEMQAASQTEGVSQRATSSPPSVKPENGDAAPPTKTKSKKRPRTDQNLDSNRREKLTKVDGGVKQEWIKMLEDFTSIVETDRGLTSHSMVEQLFLLMSQECNDSERKADIIPHRTLLASTIAATEKEDDLRHFVLLGGLPILDKWLQEAHKGKSGDGSPKEGDMAVEELLLTLLRALEKLPVDLDALKTCMVGKSVNHLRSHRNPEIQKKARKLVDMWKKRVDAEMKCSEEGKGGSMNTTGTTWPSKSASEVPGTKGRVVVGSKGASQEKSISISMVDLKSNMPSLSVYKEHPVSGAKENIAKSHVNAGIDSLAAIREDKRCSPSQSWCSGSCAGMEKARAPTLLANKNTGATLRSSSQSHLTKSSSSTGGLGSFQKEPGRFKTSTLDKVGNEGVSVSSQRLIVRLPNPARSPSQSVNNGGFLVDGSASNNTVSPPGSAGRHGLEKESKCSPAHSSEMRGDMDFIKCNSTSLVHRKEEVDKDHQGDLSPTLFVKKSTVSTFSVTLPSSSSSGRQRLVVVDNAEGGIDLLASVAAREVSDTLKTFIGSIAGDAHPLSADFNGKLVVEGRSKTDAELNVPIVSKDAEKPKQDCGVDCTPIECVGTCHKSLPPLLHGRPSGEHPQIVVGNSSGERLNDGAVESSSVDSSCWKHSSTSDALMVGKVDNDITPRESDGVCHGSSLTAELQTTSPPSLHDTSPAVEGSEDVDPGALAPKVGNSSGHDEEDALEVARQVAMEVEQEVEMHSKPDRGHDDGSSISPKCDDKFNMEAPSGHLKSKELILNDAAIDVKDSNGERPTTDAAVSKEGLTKIREATDKDKYPSTIAEIKPLVRDGEESLLGMKPMNDVIAEKEELAKGEATTGVAAMSEASGLDPMMALAKESSCGTKVACEWPIFDLNEGIATEEPVSIHSSTSSVLTAALTTQDVLPGLASSLAAPIAVLAAAAKGNFIPSPDLLRVRGELGWKGSAATSAFRPAEPRRQMEPLQLPTEATVASMTAVVDATIQKGRQTRLLDIDLNVADEKLTDEVSIASSHLLAFTNVASSVNGGPFSLHPELDLNRSDGTDEHAGPLATATSWQVGSSGTTRRVILDFDLNDGLGFGEAVAKDRSKLEGSSMSAAAGRGRSLEHVNGGPWYSAGGGSINAALSSVAAPMVVPTLSSGRSEPSFPVATASGSKPGIATGHNFSPFSNDLYRGASMPTSIPYATSMPASFSYAGLPFGEGLPFSSASFNMGSTTSHMASANLPPFLTSTPQQRGTAGAAMPSYVRPYLMGGMDSGTSWIRPNLDLNFGPDLAIDLDSGRSAGGLGQISYQQAESSSASVKRKEPEGNFDPFKSGFKQMTWR